MTTSTDRPSDWAVAQAWRELTASKMTSEGLEDVVGVGVAYLEKRARELDASSEEAPDAAVKAFWNTLGETGDYDSAIKASVDATPRAAEAGDKDGERYRWLRAEHGVINPLAHVTWKQNGDRTCGEWVNTASPASLDAAIDAAMGAVAIAKERT